MKFVKSSGALFVSSILSLILLSLLAISLFRYFTGLQPNAISFSSLLEILQNYPLDFDFTAIQNIAFNTSWGVFDFFRTFINVCITPIRWGVFICANAINCVSFLMYFIVNLLFV